MKLFDYYSDTEQKKKSNHSTIYNYKIIMVTINYCIVIIEFTMILKLFNT